MGFFCDNSPADPPLTWRENVYLASPYSHDDPEVRWERYFAACGFAAWLIERGDNVFSPIAHSHMIAETINNPNNTAFWTDLDLSFIDLWATSLFILCLPGLWRSRGVAMEYDAARALGLEVEYGGPYDPAQCIRRMFALERTMFGHMWE